MSFFSVYRISTFLILKKVYYVNVISPQILYNFLKFIFVSKSSLL